MAKKKSTKTPPSFVGEIPLPSVAEQIKAALKENSPNYPTTVISNLDYPDADKGIYAGSAKKLEQNNIYTLKKQKTFYLQQRRTNQGPSYVQKTTDQAGNSLVGKIIYIKAVFIQHTALAGAATDDYFSIKDTTGGTADDKFRYTFANATMTNFNGTFIQFDVPIRFVDGFWIDYSVDVAAGESIWYQIWGYTEDK